MYRGPRRDTGEGTGLLELCILIRTNSTRNDVVIHSDLCQGQKTCPDGNPDTHREEGSMGREAESHTM